ncbi:nucleotide sugar dehydrogenase [Sediminibacillus halophilus]|uniref:UDP-N-acetyl-D-galactosamine dehydrogenase n=1 Tax=Sediminibacillus halophilus TaxID=482461 RepID=A0A1G9VVW4_9BACI|nr:nucleotide sugar dehydrogenase [Sediminibacillus halophilus]SDM76398.1 UDP-N-acetyl-D-galactosamine dehydrogenase [Sediminibacillus halophilus]
MRAEERKGNKRIDEDGGKTATVGVVGLGYVGLPVAIGFSKRYKVIGFDVDEQKIEQLKKHNDITREISKQELAASAISYTSAPEDLSLCDYLIVAVPTPINEHKEPDLSYLIAASETVGQHLTDGVTVVYESTVYPGTTEEICIPVLEEASGLKAGESFYVAYSPERINPGDRQHTFNQIEKIVAAQNKDVLEKVTGLYQSVIDAPIFKADSIKVAETAKVLENTQRDINIALMNELAKICDKVGIDTTDVLEAAGTKWNFLPFTPGLVGGHCIGVDPYYLIYKAKTLGYTPAFLEAARKINDSMAGFVHRTVLEDIIRTKYDLQNLRITVMGITFKENVPDIRNSKALEIVQMLLEDGLSVNVYDPVADSQVLESESGIRLTEKQFLQPADILLVLVPHKEFSVMTADDISRLVKKDQALVFDLKNIWRDHRLPSSINRKTL